jgi:hypothetical protein
MFAINRVSLYVCALFLNSIFRVPLNVVVRTPGGTLTPGWESLVYTIRIFKTISKCRFRFASSHVCCVNFNVGVGNLKLY